MSLETCFCLVATLPSYLGIPGSWPRENKFKNMENHERIYLKTWTMYVFFETTVFFYILFHERHADGAPFFIYARPFFDWNFPRPFFRSLLCVFFVRSK